MSVRIYDAEIALGVSLWPTERSWDWLMSKKENMPGPMYRAQYRNDPSGLKGVRYEIDWLQFYTQNELPPFRELRGVQSGDPATSMRETSNYFGHATAAKSHTTGIIYILAVDFGHKTAPEHIEYMREHYKMWSQKGLTISKVLLETGGPQQSTVQNLLAQTRLDPSGPMPIEEFKPKGSKEERFDSIMTWLRNGTVRFLGDQRGDRVEISNQIGFQEFLHEFSQFPVGGRDDVLDAVYMCVQSLVSSGVAAGIIAANQTLLNIDNETEIERAERVAHEKDERMRQYDDNRRVGKESIDVRERVLSRSGRSSLFHARRF